jgi:putative thioredoxin
MLGQLPPELAKNKAFDPIRAALELAEQATKCGAVGELQSKLQQDPADYQARFDLALAHYAAGEREEAVEQLLEIVRRARGWNEDAARKQLVKFFEAFGPADPLTISARKRLSSILFS